LASVSSVGGGGGGGATGPGVVVVVVVVELPRPTAHAITAMSTTIPITTNQTVVFDESSEEPEA
jgi:hypothetical protein